MAPGFGMGESDVIEVGRGGELDWSSKSLDLPRMSGTCDARIFLSNSTSIPEMQV
jgi:hypothetical protein